MMGSQNREFTALVLEKARARQDEPFEPFVTYDRDGDCVVFVAEAVSFYAERIDNLVTAYYDNQEPEKIVGAVIKDFSKFCQRVFKKHPGFQIVVQDGRVRLDFLFLAHVMSVKPEKVPGVTYQKLVSLARDTNAVAELVSA